MLSDCRTSGKVDFIKISPLDAPTIYEAVVQHKCSFRRTWTPVLLAGKILGVMNIDGLFKPGNPEETWMSSRWTNLYSTLIAAPVISTQVFNLIEQMRAENGVGFRAGVYGFARKTSVTWFLSIFILLGWIKRVEFCKLLKKFHNLMCTSSTSTCWKTLLSVTFIVLIGIAENAFFDVTLVMSIRGDTQTWLQKLFLVYSRRSRLAPYPIIGIVRWIINKILTYSWSYLDILIILMSRGLAYEFHLLRNELIKYFQNPGGDEDIESGMRKRNNSLPKIYERFLTILDLTGEFNRFFSPILIALYFTNIVLISNHISKALVNTDLENGLRTVYMTLSLVQFLTRIILVTLSCGEIHYQGRKLEETLNYVEPLGIKSKIISRMLKQIRSSTSVGVDVYGMFVIKRSTLLYIINFLFSFQIVLMQSEPMKQ